MEIDSMRESILLYESQLVQVNSALEVTPKGDEYDSLTSLKLDLQELINLTNENVIKLTSKVQKESGNSPNNRETNNVEIAKDNLDDEYALFMAEMSKNGAYEDDKVEKNVEEKEKDLENTDIEDELNSLEGTHCGVYFTHKWGGAPSLYNAMVCSVIKDDINTLKKYDDIQVRILFTNPTHIEMVPCPYFLNGECKFDEDECRFSHGEIVPLASLKEAIQPNYSNLKLGSRVLAKIRKNEDIPMSNKQSEKYLLWHRGVIKHLDLENHKCQIKLENDSLLKSNVNDYKVDLGDIFPLTDECGSDSDSLNESDDDFNLKENTTYDNIVEKSFSSNLGEKLGDWEKHTKGMGSRLMLKMGYIIGTGLGPQGEGRIEPVPCRITPAGRSLDHCMKLREESSSEDPLKVEKKLRRLEKKKEDREKKAYERLKNKEKHNVFNFLNNTLSFQSNENVNDIETSNISKNKGKSKVITDIKSSSCKNLNIEQFKLAEDIKKTEKDIIKLKDSMIRNSKDSSVHNGLSVKLSSKLDEMENLKKRQLNISNEQSSRKDQRKLTIF